MDVAEVVDLDGAQVVKLPSGIHVRASQVSVRREGDSLILSPLKPATWPVEFFEAIRIDDASFSRPKQGPLPPAPTVEN